MTDQARQQARGCHLQGKVSIGRYIFRGGDRTDPRYKAYVDRWLDYALTLGGRINRV